MENKAAPDQSWPPLTACEGLRPAALALERCWQAHELSAHAALLWPWRADDWPTRSSHAPCWRERALNAQLPALRDARPELIPALVIYEEPLVTAREIYAWRRGALHEPAPALWLIAPDQAPAACGGDLWESLTTIFSTLHARYALLALRERRRGDGSADAARDQLADFLEAIDQLAARG